MDAGHHEDKIIFYVQVLRCLATDITGTLFHSNRILNSVLFTQDGDFVHQYTRYKTCNASI